METIAQFMSRDHERLAALLSSLRAEKDPPRARRLFGEFKEGLDRHIRAEEDLLFPVLERASPEGRRGATSVMDAEHHEIQALLRAAAGSLARGEGGLEAIVSRLAAILETHAALEDRRLYPAVDQAASGPEAKAILDVLRSRRESALAASGAA